MRAAIFIPTVSPTQSLSSLQHSKHFSFSPFTTTFIHQTTKQLPSLLCTQTTAKVSASLPSSSAPKTRLYVSGLSFRTTEGSLRNAFQNFGKLVEVNLVMDKLANRPRGFAFLRYATEEESQNAIEGMHGKFLDGRVIFVEVAKPRSELRKNKQTRL